MQNFLNMEGKRMEFMKVDFFRKAISRLDLTIDHDSLVRDYVRLESAKMYGFLEPMEYTKDRFLNTVTLNGWFREIATHSFKETGYEGWLVVCQVYAINPEWTIEEYLAEVKNYLSTF